MSVLAALGTIQITGNNITVSGLSFKPTLVLFWTIGANTSSTDLTSDSRDLVRNFGAMNSTNQFCYSMYERNGGTGGTNSYDLLTTSACIVFNAGVSNMSVDTHGEYSFGSMNADGFTINVNASGSPTYAAQVQYLALGGSDLTNTVIGTVSLVAGVTGNQSVTGFGFRPTALIGVTGNQDSVSNSSYIGPFLGALSVGFFDGVHQFVSAVMSDGSGSAQQNVHYSRTDEFFCTDFQGDSAHNPTAAVYGSAVSLDADGFTINTLGNTSPTNPTILAYIGLGGIVAAVGNFATQTNTSSNMQVSGNVTPSAGLLLSVNDVQSVPGTVQTGGTSMTLGGFVAANNRNATAANSSDNASPTVCDSSIAYDKVYLNILAGTATLQGAMDMVSVNNDGFTTVMTTADPQVNLVGYLILGIKVVPPPIATLIGFSPNFYEGQNNAGLGIFIATGSINGVVYPGGVYFASVTLNTSTGLLNAPVTVYFWVTASGQVQQGSNLPRSGVYPIAQVVVDNILTGTRPNGFSPQITQAPGIRSITDIRPITNPGFHF